MARMLLFLLLMIWCENTLAAIPTRQWHSHDVHCKMTSFLDSPYVSAYLQKEVYTQGCTTNTTVADTLTDVHVIHYHGNTERNIELVFADYDGKGFDKTFVIVLASQNKVYWKVKIPKQSINMERNTFVVSTKSVVMFTNKNMESRPSVNKLKDLPTNDDDALLLKITEKFSNVTSFTSFSQANHVTLEVGKALNLLHSESVCKIHAIDERFHIVKVIYKETKPVEGCILNHRSDTSTRHAYVIELKHVNYGKPFEVNLELRRLSHQTVDKEFWLVLKSPSHVTWHVHTKKVQGFINIVANSFVDMSGIRMHTVAVRSEELTESGLDLLRWVEYFLVPTAMYTSMNDSDYIQITLPNIEEFAEHELQYSPNLDSEKANVSLKMALQTECGKDWVIVAIDKHVLQHLGIKTNMVTLLDPQCTSLENSTHVYLQSAANACGTNVSDSRNGKMAFFNSIVVHMSDTVREEPHDTGEGSGLEEVLTGSGDRQLTDLILDDEDLVLHPLEVNFKCEMYDDKTVIQSSLQPQDPVFELNLYASEISAAPIVPSPIKVAQIDTPLYIQAKVTSDPLLRAHLQNCWITDISSSKNGKRYMLIENGCAIDLSVRHLYSSQPQSESLSFTFENFVKYSTSSSIELECQLTACCIDTGCAIHRYQTCVDARTGCEMGSKKDINIQVRTMIVGPIIIPKFVTQNHDAGIPDVICKDNGAVAGQEREPVVIVGLDSETVVGIAFAAFIMGAMMMGALWFIHTHSGSFFSTGPLKQINGTRETLENEEGYVESTPGSCAPIST